MLQSKTRSEDPKTQKLQGCILKVVGVISKVTDTLINLKSSKKLSINNLRNSIGPMVHDCTDSLALLNHVNSSLEQTPRDNIAYCLDNQYHALRRNVPFESKFLSGDDLPKRIMSPLIKSYLVCHQSHIIPLLKLQKTCVDSLKTLGIALRMGTKGITLVDTRNLTTTVTATAASTKNKREIKYGKSTWI